ncbi:hypothetical protein [Actinokineospora sp. NBRC 105648]|uniref:hypothetical protein n=1 Tax=Actinokineospora sp. NBRC 105648 TaxID=3032206 RepID=UPI0024A594FA|nr:hypothetical protein [Actinokineospora sp. NBRC 105648]GLZ37298.1 hypothetical protein Acsp05_09230 [Actinokineospora sp. NBRC 105648]
MGQARVDVELTARTDQSGSAEVDAAVTESVTPGVWFAAPQEEGGGAREPSQVWELSGRPYEGKVATGTAHVYLGEGNSALTRPFLFADGFNYGPSDLPGVFNHFNVPYGANDDRFLDQLLAAGIDVVLLGFTERHTYIQANAEVAISAIQHAIAERQGDHPLTVGGVSMGGVVTRFALAKLEHEGVDHETATYVSYDSPHNGAWIPLILQQLAYFFENLPGQPADEPGQADLIRSEAAQQLLWAWVPDAKYSGPVATSSDLRGTFLDDLAALGQWPARPRKLGVANGTGDSTGRDLPPGEVAFDWKAGVLASATARFQPDRGTRQPIGGMNLGFEIRRPETSDVPALDGAPGGVLESFGLVADKLGIEIPAEYRGGCFVPTISATAQPYSPTDWELDPYAPLDPEGSALDEYTTDSQNTAHGVISEPLARWLLDRLI